MRNLDVKLAPNLLMQEFLLFGREHRRGHFHGLDASGVVSQIQSNVSFVQTVSHGRELGLFQVQNGFRLTRI